MDKQRPVNKVVHNDAYSASLMEMYTKWMDGDCFQGSNIPEAFEGMDPQSHGAEVEDITKKKKKMGEILSILFSFCFIYTFTFCRAFIQYICASFYIC